MKVKMIIYANYEEVKEIPDEEIKGMTEDEIQDYVNATYMDKFIDNNVQTDVEIME